MRHAPQEPDAVPSRAIAAVGAGALIAAAIGVLVAYAIGACSAHDLAGGWQFARGPDIPTEVNAMETRVFDIEAQGLELNQRAEAYLSRFGWVDRDGGIVHVPIGVAYELLIERQNGGPR